MTTYRYEALASKVLAVAVIHPYGWTAFCDAVPGLDHEEEYMDVARDGDKLLKELAVEIFPDLKEEEYLK